MDTYPESLEEKLGFDVVREHLATEVMSPLGTERLERMKPARTLGWMRAELERVAELQDAFTYGQAVPLNHIFDVRADLKQAAPEEAYLDPEPLKAIRLTLVTLRRLKRYFADRSADYPRLAQAVERITPLPDLEQHIQSILDDDGSIRDDASNELARIRRQIRQRERELRRTLESALRSAIQKGYATEEQPTIRAGRMVIPVRVEAKRKVDGFVHDTSATGQTVYIEPAACLQLNNAVRELKSEERREIERILRRVTRHVRAEMDAVQTGQTVLAQFDLLQAKARLANRLEAVVPTLNTEGIVDIHDGRNPALALHLASNDGREAPGDLDSPEEVVPLNLMLGRDFHTLVITGPNAGGKTVAMKSVGLFSLMLAYGVPIPVAPHSSFPLFDRIMVDIGDEQSIEEDLSTFSSHVANLRQMLSEADANTLVLIDEAGTGTDPDEGGALAQALLQRLTATGTRTIATTHHGTLKVYAHEAEDVQNGSMEFDQTTLRPTYRYQQGVPGSSYAFEIAQRMGLDDDLLDRARDLAGERKTAMEDLISTFEKRNQDLADELYDARKAREQAEKEQQRFEQKWRKLNKERDDFRQQALEEAERIVQGANARIEQTIKEIKEAEAEREATKAARERLEDFKEDLKEDLKEERAEVDEATDDEAGPDHAPRDASTTPEGAGDGARPHPAAPAPGPITAGDRVRLDDGATTLDVQDVEDGEAVVTMGAMHMRVDLDRLTKVGGPQQTTESAGTGTMPSLQAQPSIDVRGARVEEALHRVERFIDDAIAAGLETVEILHGKGTGALREAIQDALRKRSDVSSVDTAPIEQGGAGVTLVALA